MSWPPPPPPIGLGGPDEFDFPLPPPPVFGEEDLVIPVQVLPKKSNPGGDSSCTSTSISSGVKTECVRVIAEAEPQKVSTSQRIVPPHLNIPPPPSYTAPPPPDKAVSRPVTKNVSRISKKVSPLPPCKEVSPPPPSKDISPPLPKEVAALINDGPATQEASLAPPSEVSIQPALESAKEKTPEPVPTPPVDIPLPPPLPVQGLASKKHESSPDRKEEQTPELSSAPVQHDDSNPIVTPSLLQMVKLRSVNSSPEVSTSSSGSEAPQKPIRKSLIITSPTSTSPPAIVTSQPALPKIQPVVVPPSPTSTASFIFSKSNKKVVTETKQVVGTKATVQKNQEVFPLTKVVSEEELVQKGVKVPPPVAKKPQTKGKEIETTSARSRLHVINVDHKLANLSPNGQTNLILGNQRQFFSVH
uniref:Uncharacterized protein n=1 Tax=Mola mola TaxID=94237 RepID=A0A3Q4AF53_MOLML